MNYLSAHTLDEALGALARDPRKRIVCGATDVFADAGLVPAKSEWIDISRIDVLRGIERHDNVVRIGAATSFDAIAGTPWLPVALTQAAAGVGSRQIRVQGTLGGNLCHASPIADGMPPLLALDAQVELASPRGVRRLPLADFVLGNRRTALGVDELLIAVRFELPRRQDRTAFVKCANREGAALAVVSAAMHLRLSADATVEAAAVAVGGASAVALRLRAIEAALLGARCTDSAALSLFEPAAAVEAALREALSPIDDCRATASHRIHLARVAIARALRCCIEESSHDASTA